MKKEKEELRESIYQTIESSSSKLIEDVETLKKLEIQELGYIIKQSIQTLRKL